MRQSFVSAVASFARYRESRISKAYSRLLPSRRYQGYLFLAQRCSDSLCGTLPFRSRDDARWNFSKFICICIFTQTSWYLSQETLFRTSRLQSPLLVHARTNERTNEIGEISNKMHKNSYIFVFTPRDWKPFENRAPWQSDTFIKYTREEERSGRVSFPRYPIASEDILR